MAFLITTNCVAVVVEVFISLVVPLLLTIFHQVWELLSNSLIMFVFIAYAESL
jgi:hypothetical protein